MKVCMYVPQPAAGPPHSITPKFGMGSAFHPGSEPSYRASQNVDLQPSARPQPCPRPCPLLLLNSLDQGFSTFRYPRTPKSKLYPSVYPQIKIICPSRTPKSKILPKRASFEHFFFIFRTPCYLLTYP